MDKDKVCEEGEDGWMEDAEYASCGLVVSGSHVSSQTNCSKEFT